MTLKQHEVTVNGYSCIHIDSNGVECNELTVNPHSVNNHRPHLWLCEKHDDVVSGVGKRRAKLQQEWREGRYISS